MNLFWLSLYVTSCVWIIGSYLNATGKNSYIFVASIFYSSVLWPNSNWFQVHSIRGMGDSSIIEKWENCVQLSIGWENYNKTKNNFFSNFISIFSQNLYEISSKFLQIITNYCKVMNKFFTALYTIIFFKFPWKLPENYSYDMLDTCCLRLKQSKNLHFILFQYKFG